MYQFIFVGRLFSFLASSMAVQPLLSSVPHHPVVAPTLFHYTPCGDYNQNESMSAGFYKNKYFNISRFIFKIGLVDSHQP